MPHTFTVQVDSAMMKQAWRAWFFREQRIWPLVAAVALIVISAVDDLRHGSVGTISIIGLTVLGGIILLFASSYQIGLRRSLSRLDAIVDGKATYTLTDSTINAVSSLGSFSLDWSTVAELRRYHDLILLGFKDTMYSTIPAAQIPADSLSFMIERCRASGARLVDL